MDRWVWIALIIIVVLLVGSVLLLLAKKKRTTAELRRTFGPEYDRVLSGSDSRRAGERELRDRLERRRGYDLRPLPAESRDRYAELWGSAEAMFVDSPSGAVGQAVGLLTDLMRERGFPAESPERRADDLSVSDPEAAQRYRESYRVVQANERGEATSEGLRQAMMDLRVVFEALADPPGPASSSSTSTPGQRRRD